MDFEYSAKVKTLQTRLRAFMDECVYPNEQRYEEEVQTGDRWQPTTLVEELKQKARAAGLWNLFLPEFPLRGRVDEPRIRAALRDHGPCRMGGRGFQLLRARHRQHGNARALRDRGTETGMARTAARRCHPLLLRDDRAGSGLIRCHQYRKPYRAATATTTSSTAANGGPPEDPTGDASSLSSWARPIRRIRNGTGSSR